MTTDGSTFLTERLRVRDWQVAERAGAVDDLPAVVAAMLTEPVTRWLPSEWHGPYSHARAAAWIADRDSEGPVLLVEDRAQGQPLGLILLFEETADGTAAVDVRLGYLLAEEAWGRGLGSELLGGFIAWCRGRPEVRSVTGGVAPQNTASIRLLQRHGFVPVPGSETDGDLTYRLELVS